MPLQMPDQAAPQSPDEAHAVRRRLYRVLAIVAVGLFVALLAYGLLSKATNRSVDESLAKGNAPTAPEFEDVVLDRGKLPGELAATVGPALSDAQLSLRELRGTPLILNFWASWCVPCREEAKALNQLQEERGGPRFTVLGIDTEDLSPDAKAFVKRYGVRYPQLRDGQGDFGQDFGTTGVPESYLFDPQGVLREAQAGPVTEEMLRERFLPLIPKGSS